MMWFLHGNGSKSLIQYLFEFANKSWPVSSKAFVIQYIGYGHSWQFGIKAWYYYWMHFVWKYMFEIMYVLLNVIGVSQKNLLWMKIKYTDSQVGDCINSVICFVCKRNS